MEHPRSSRVVNIKGIDIQVVPHHLQTHLYLHTLDLNTLSIIVTVVISILTGMIRTELILITPESHTPQTVQNNTLIDTEEDLTTLTITPQQVAIHVKALDISLL